MISYFAKNMQKAVDIVVKTAGVMQTWWKCSIFSGSLSSLSITLLITPEVKYRKVIIYIKYGMKIHIIIAF